MGKTHDALIRAEQEYEKNALVTFTGHQKALVESRSRKHLSQPVPRWYEEIKSRLEIKYAGNSPKTILFTGTSHGAGVSMASQGYAHFLANANPYKVFLIIFDLYDAQRNRPDAVDKPHELSDVFTIYSQLDTDYNQNRNSNLLAATCSKQALGSGGFFQSPRFDEVLQSMRENFDYVILDAPPVTLFSETRTLCKMFDGIILVLEFEQTRKQVALKAKQELEDAGGNLLGIVINRRKYYIPQWIYRRL